MNGADPRARQHGNGGFDDHRHVERDPVAFLDATRLHGVGKTADHFVQLLVGHMRIIGVPS